MLNMSVKSARIAAACGHAHQDGPVSLRRHGGGPDSLLVAADLLDRAHLAMGPPDEGMEEDKDLRQRGQCGPDEVAPLYVRQLVRQHHVYLIGRALRQDRGWQHDRRLP
jgi:hypothetical protein